MHVKNKKNEKRKNAAGKEISDDSLHRVEEGVVASKFKNGKSLIDYATS